MSSTVRNRATVLTRAGALLKHAEAVEAYCRRDALKPRVRDVKESLREARAWLTDATTADPVLVTHIARMVDNASQRLYAVMRQMN
jgi:hypothetical protein